MRVSTLGATDVWGSETYDFQYGQVAESIAPGILDYARQIQAAGESLIGAISRARLQVAMTDAQRDLLNIQIERARNGLPPLAVNAYTSGGASIDSRTLTILLIVLVGILAFKRG